MQLNRYTARESDKGRVLRTIGWCKRNHLTLAGLPYDDNLVGNDGISIEIITPPGMSREMLEQAVKEGYSERDVVRHRILECPIGWFIEADGKAFDHEVFLITWLLMVMVSLPVKPMNWRSGGSGRATIMR